MCIVAVYELYYIEVRLGIIISFYYSILAVLTLKCYVNSNIYCTLLARGHSQKTPFVVIGNMKPITPMYKM